MARRGVQAIIALLLAASLAGCLTPAHTANLYGEVEGAAFSQTGPEEGGQDVMEVEITPLPVQEATPFIASPSPSPSPTGSPEVAIASTPEPSPANTLVPLPASKQRPAYKVKEIDDQKAYLNTGSANLRKGPGTEYDIVMKLERLCKLTVTGSCGEWLRVKAGDDKGFVLAEFVEYGAPPTPTPSAKPTKTPSATATSSPSPNATATAKPEETPGQTGGSNDYFTDANGYTADELLLIAQVVHEEAKGNSLEAQAAVANTIYNRIKSSRFPNSVKGVIFQKNQYTVVRSAEQIGAVKPSSKAVDAVLQIFVDENTILPADVMYFRTASKGTFWSDNYEYYGTYGNNSFFIFVG